MRAPASAIGVQTIASHAHAQRRDRAREAEIAPCRDQQPRQQADPPRHILMPATCLMGDRVEVDQSDCTIDVAAAHCMSDCAIDLADRLEPLADTQIDATTRSGTSDNIFSPDQLTHVIVSSRTRPEMGDVLDAPPDQESAPARSHRRTSHWHGSCAAGRRSTPDGWSTLPPAGPPATRA